MKNELRKASDNPWLEYGNAITARSIIGDLLKFGKGDFLAGMENREIRLGTKFTAVMDSLMAGYQHWWNATPGEPSLVSAVSSVRPQRSARPAACLSSAVPRPARRREACTTGVTAA